jgi:hypothetical protein
MPIGDNYLFQVGSGTQQVANLRWEVRADGLIDFDAAFDAYLSGRGTDTLVVHGHPIEIDADGARLGQLLPDRDVRAPGRTR